MTRLAAPGWPSSLVIATALTSAVAKIAPMKIRAKVMIWTGRSRIAEPLPPCSRGLTRGSVERCRMNAADPNASNSVLASIPASGNSATLRPTDKDAPAI